MVKERIPEVQYALFCKDIIEGKEEFTLKGVAHELFVPNPGDISIYLVLRLLNVHKGIHKIIINCMIVPKLQLLTLDIPLNVEKYGNCLISEKIMMPITTSNDYIFTILFNGTPIKRLTLPIHVLHTQ